MSAKPQHITFSSTDPFELATFWSKVTGYPLADDDFPGDPEASVLPPSGPILLFVTVPDEKASARNRVHLDLQPDTTRDQEVDRLLGIGATLVDDQRKPDGRGWVVLADPEGNEFCVERSAAEKAAKP
ncbi:VOC family protein [Umezawaea sp.]|uniref:VOC family protein n=1 Tax=Umezawaea sp. TaxID=1955258 RepID=UPI002ED225FF